MIVQQKHFCEHGAAKSPRNSCEIWGRDSLLCHKQLLVFSFLQWRPKSHPSQEPRKHLAKRSVSSNTTIASIRNWSALKIHYNTKVRALASTKLIKSKHVKTSWNSGCRIIKFQIRPFNFQKYMVKLQNWKDKLKLTVILQNHILQTKAGSYQVILQLTCYSMYSFNVPSP